MSEPAVAPSPLIPIPRGPVPEAPPTPARRLIEIRVDGKSVSVPDGATILDAVPKLGHRYAHALLPRDPRAGQRLPRVRGGAGRLAHAGPGLLTESRTGHGDPHRFRTGSPQPPLWSSSFWPRP